MLANTFSAYPPYCLYSIELRDTIQPAPALAISSIIDYTISQYYAHYKLNELDWNRQPITLEK